MPRILNTNNSPPDAFRNTATPPPQRGKPTPL
jgi:hypothetical protein